MRERIKVLLISLLIETTCAESFHHYESAGILLVPTTKLEVFSKTSTLPVSVHFQIPKVQNTNELTRCNYTNEQIVNASSQFNNMLKKRISRYIDLSPIKLALEDSGNTLKSSDFDCASSHSCTFSPTMFADKGNKQHLSIRPCSEIGSKCEGPHIHSHCCSLIISHNMNLKDRCPVDITQFSGMKTLVYNYFRYKNVSPQGAICVSPHLITNIGTNSSYRISFLAGNLTGRYLPSRHTRSIENPSDIPNTPDNRAQHRAYSIAKILFGFTRGLLKGLSDSIYSMIYSSNPEGNPGSGRTEVGSRKRRSLLSYWAQGGPLSPHYIDQSIENLLHIENNSISDIKKSLDKQISLAVKAETSNFLSIEKELCQVKSQNYYNSLLVALLSRQNELESSIENALQRCYQDKVPFQIPMNHLSKLCKAASETPQACDSHKLLNRFGCKIGLPAYTSDQILLNLILTMKSLPEEDLLKTYRIVSVPIPITNQIYSQEVTSTIKPDVSNDVILNDLILNLNSLAEKSRSRRSSVNLFHFLSIKNLPDFVATTDGRQYKAFHKQDCSKKDSRYFCNIGQSSLKSSQCLQRVFQESNLEYCDTVTISQEQSCNLKYFEYLQKANYLIASHEPVTLITPNSKSWFSTDHSNINCHRSCVLPQQNVTGAFKCNDDSYAVEHFNKDDVEVFSHQKWNLKFRDIAGSDITGFKPLDQMIFNVDDYTKDKWKSRLQVITFTFVGIMTPVFTLILFFVLYKTLKNRTKRIMTTFWCCKGNSYSPQNAEIANFIKSLKSSGDGPQKPSESTKMLDL